MVLPTDGASSPLPERAALLKRRPEIATCHDSGTECIQSGPSSRSLSSGLDCSWLTGSHDWKTMHTSDANLSNLPRRGRETDSWEEYLCGSSRGFVRFLPVSHMCVLCVLVFLDTCEAGRASRINFRQSSSSGKFKSLLPLE